LFATLALNSLSLTAEPLFPQAPGMVSYTYRDALKKDLAGTLDLIRALGITDMEFSNLFGKTAAEIRSALDARGMVCSSFGVSHAEALQDTSTVAASAKTLGAKFVRVAWVPNRQPFTLAHAELTAAEFNRIGKELLGESDIILRHRPAFYEHIAIEFELQASRYASMTAPDSFDDGIAINRMCHGLPNFRICQYRMILVERD
jgi:hypothetical protein